MAKIRVLLADDHTIFREGLRAILRYYEDVEVVGEASDGAEAVAKVGEAQPHVVVMDVAMPGMNGIEATRVIRHRYPATQVLILSQYSDPDYVSALVKNGASGYILKQSAGADLIAALRALARGEVFLHPAAAAAMVQEIRRDQEPITPREREVLQGIVNGQTSAQIAELLFLSVNTVDWHRTNLMHKAGAHNIAQLIDFARRNRMVQTDD